VTDPYFRFWFRFIERNRATIDRGLGERLIDDVIEPQLDAHLGPVFEAIARDFTTGLLIRGELEGLDVGSWWSTDGEHEIDIVTVAQKAVTNIGTVKWRSAPLGREVYRNLAGTPRRSASGTRSRGSLSVAVGSSRLYYRPNRTCGVFQRKISTAKGARTYR